MRRINGWLLLEYCILILALALLVGVVGGLLTRGLP